MLVKVRVGDKEYGDSVTHFPNLQRLNELEGLAKERGRGKGGGSYFVFAGKTRQAVLLFSFPEDIAPGSRDAESVAWFDGLPPHIGVNDAFDFALGKALQVFVASGLAAAHPVECKALSLLRPCGPEEPQFEHRILVEEVDRSPNQRPGAPVKLRSFAEPAGLVLLGAVCLGAGLGVARLVWPPLNHGQLAGAIAAALEQPMQAETSTRLSVALRPLADKVSTEVASSLVPNQQESPLVKAIVEKLKDNLTKIIGQEVQKRLISVIPNGGCQNVNNNVGVCKAFEVGTSDAIKGIVNQGAILGAIRDTVVPQTVSVLCDVVRKSVNIINSNGDISLSFTITKGRRTGTGAKTTECSL